MIKVGNNNIGSVMVGNTSIGKIYKGNDLIYEQNKNGFYFISNSESINLKLKNISKYDTIYCNANERTFYEINPLSWNDYISFYNSSFLVSLDLHKLDTSKVTMMNNMFFGCSSLISLDLSMLNADICTSLSNMFGGCSSLKSLNLSNFNKMPKIPQNAPLIYSNETFKDCNSLTYIKCKSGFQKFCWKYQDTMLLPEAMREGGSGVWEIVD